MAGVLLDTNVLSELRKGPRCDAKVRAWLALQESQELFLSVLAIAEIRDGIERLRGRDPKQAARLEAWLNETETFFRDRILPITPEIADRWGRLRTPQPLPDFDRLIAATAAHHGLEIATRNIRDFERTGIPVTNPWQEG